MKGLRKYLVIKISRLILLQKNLSKKQKVEIYIMKILKIIMKKKNFMVIIFMISVLPQMLWAQNHYESGNIKIENNAKEDSTLSIVLHFANDVIVEHDSIVNDRQSIIVGLFNRADISEISYYLLTKDNIVKCVFNNYELKSKNIYKIQNSFCTKQISYQPLKCSNFIKE